MSSRRKPKPEKKSKKGLIIGLIIAAVAVVIIIVIVVIVLLLRRRQNNAATTTPPDSSDSGGQNGGGDDGGEDPAPECEEDGDCQTGQVCRLADGVCVGCIVPGDCGPLETCNTATNECVGPECEEDVDCTTTALPVCDSNNCVQCLVDLDCSGNPLYSGQGKNFCDPTGFICKNCVDDSDCGLSSICSTSGCCDLSAPEVTTANLSGNAWNRTISGAYIVSDPLIAADKSILRFYDAVDTLLYTQGQETADGFYSVKQSDMDDLPLFPGFVYKVTIQLIRECGTTAESTPFDLTIPAAPADGFSLISNTNAQNVITINVKMSSFSPYLTGLRFGIVTSQNNTFSPLSPTNTGRALSSTFLGTFNIGLGLENYYSFSYTIPNATFGQTWHYYIWAEGTQANGQVSSGNLIPNPLTLGPGFITIA